MYSAITDYIFFEKLPFFGLTSYTRKVLLLNTSLKYLVYKAAPYRISLQNRGCFEGVKCEGSSFPSSGIWNIQIQFVYIVGIMYDQYIIRYINPTISPKNTYMSIRQVDRVGQCTSLRISTSRQTLAILKNDKTGIVL